MILTMCSRSGSHTGFGIGNLWPAFRSGLAFTNSWWMQKQTRGTQVT